MAASGVRFTEETTVKCSLEAFCKDPVLLAKLRELAPRMARIVTETSHFISLCVLKVFSEALAQKTWPAPEEPWTSKRVLECMYVVTSCKLARAKLDAELLALRQQHYDSLRGPLPLECRDGIPWPALEEAATRMAAAINTNIKEHFYERQLQFIALRQNLDMKKKEDREMAREQQRAINKAARGPTTDSSLPTVIKTCVPYDLEAYPEHFLWPMFTMNTLLESKQMHTFRLVPLSQGFVPGACLHICTGSLVQIVGESDPRLAAYNQALNRRLAPQQAATEVEKATTDVLAATEEAANATEAAALAAGAVAEAGAAQAAAVEAAEKAASAQDAAEAAAAAAREAAEAAAAARDAAEKTVASSLAASRAAAKAAAAAAAVAPPDAAEAALAAAASKVNAAAATSAAGAASAAAIAAGDAARAAAIAAGAAASAAARAAVPITAEQAVVAHAANVAAATAAEAAVAARAAVVEARATLQKRKYTPKGRKSDEASLNEKDLCWLPLFRLKKLAPRSQAHKRLGHHLTTDGVSVSVVILRRRRKGDEGVAKKKKKNKRTKKSGQLHNMASGAPLPARHIAPVDAAKVVGCDPGKHQLLHLTNECSPMVAEGRKTLRYTFK